MSDSKRSSERLNPYVGPRTFEEADGRFYFGREREARELHSLVVAEPLVIFSGQSGAGKSSILNTRLIPYLHQDGFQVLPTGRVGGSSHNTHDNIPNIFVYNLILSIDRGRHNSIDLQSLTLEQYLQQYHVHTKDEEGDLTGTVLIIDQFEELVTNHLERWGDRAAFYKQLNDAILADDLLWVVLTMREDYTAALLDPYKKLLSGRTQARFYLQRMELDAALDAIERPALLGERPFDEDVAYELAENLLQVNNQDGSQSRGQYIEPVQLQVVCYQLWEQLKAKPLAPITQEDVDELGDVDEALAHFYEQIITAVLQETHATTELTLRNWFDAYLITEAGTRGTVYMDQSETATMGNDVVRLLANRYLLRAEIRAGGTWYELIHDRFIVPIQQANLEWRLAQSSLIQAAQQWENSQRPNEKLYQDELLEEALASVDMESAEPLVKTFLEAGIAYQSQRDLADVQAEAERQTEIAQAEADAATRLRRFAFALVIIVAIGAIIAVVALFFLFQANDARDEADLAQINAENHRISAEAARIEEEEQQKIAEDARVEAVAQQSTAEALSATAVAEEEIAEALSATAEAEKAIAVAAQEEANVQEALANNNLENVRGQKAEIDEVRTQAENNRRLQVAQSLAFHILDAVAASDMELALLLAEEASNLDQEGVTNVQTTVNQALKPLSAIDYRNHTLFAHDGPVFDFALSSENLLTTYGADGQVLIWNLNVDGASPLGLPVADDLDFIRLANNGTAVLTLNSDGNGAIWNPAEPEAPSTPISLGEQVLSVDIAPDGSQIAYANDKGEMKQWQAIDNTIETLAGFDNSNFTAVQFTEDGDFVSSRTNRQGRQFIYEKLEDGRLILRTDLQRIPVSIYTDEDNNRWQIISVGNQAIFWYDDLQREIAYSFIGNNGGPNSLDINDADAVLATASGSRVLLRQLDPFRVTTSATYPVDRLPFAVLGGHEGIVTKVRFWEDTDQLITAGEDGTIRLWYPQLHYLYNGTNIIDQSATSRFSSGSTGNYDTTYETGAVAMALSPDGAQLVTAQPDDMLLLWAMDDLESGPQQLSGAVRDVHRVAFSPDGQYIAVADGRLHEAGQLYVWNTNNLTAQPEILTDHSLPVQDIAFTPDSRHLISGGGEGRQSVSSDNHLRVWEMSNLQDGPVITLPEFEDGITSLAVSPNGDWLAVGFRTAELKLYSLDDIENGEPIEFKEASEFITSLAFDPQNQLLASARANGVISIWDVGNPSLPKYVYSSHAGVIETLAFAPDGKTLASGGDDSLIRLWSIGDLSGQPLILRGHETAVSDILITEDGNHLISAGADTIRLWPTLQSIQANRCQLVGRNFTQTEWERYFGDEPYRLTCDQYPAHYSTLLDESE